jgi:hypothetical protein
MAEGERNYNFKHAIGFEDNLFLYVVSSNSRAQKALPGAPPASN